MNPASTSRISTFAEFLVVSLLLAVYAAASYSAAQTNTATWEGPLYIAAGASYTRTNDYRLNPETGNWPQQVAGAWPAVRGGVSGRRRRASRGLSELAPRQSNPARQDFLLRAE